jgi:lytic murein transglycosylase
MRMLDAGRAGLFSSAGREAIVDKSAGEGGAGGKGDAVRLSATKLGALGVGVAVAATAAAGAAEASLKSCVAGIERAAVRAGVSRGVAREAFAGFDFDELVLRQSRNQAEFDIPIWDYMAFLVDDERIADGRAMLERHKDVLARVEKRYGVDRHIIVALWGIESDYGKRKGSHFIPHALANLACKGRRARFFRKELIQALRLVSRGDIALDDLRGSWAGAFGHTQFMPSTYRRLAVDFDGDGRRDLVNSVPDALASTANFLRRAGWKPGQRWGREVTVPKRYRGRVGRKRTLWLRTWRKRGIRRVDGGPLRARIRAGLIRPAGRNGPAFLVYRNFNALYAYNAAESYALAISHLSDRLQGMDPISTSWPTDDPGLSRAQRLELQERLIAAGYDIGTADGLVGPRTREGIRKAEADLGMEPTGRPGMKIFEALAPARAAASEAPTAPSGPAAEETP